MTKLRRRAIISRSADAAAMAQVARAMKNDDVVALAAYLASMAP